jgi:hypothetical protein
MYFLPLRSFRLFCRFGMSAPSLIGILLAAGCGGSSSTVSTTPSISITGSGQVRLGSTDQFTATVNNE